MTEQATGGMRVTGDVQTTEVDHGIAKVERNEVINLGVVDIPAGIYPVMLRVEAGETVNTGDFNSRKFNVGVTVPCIPTDGAMEEAYTRATAWVDRKLDSRAAGARRERELFLEGQRRRQGGGGGGGGGGRSSSGGGHDPYFG
jgi:uncharacterized membrane protein YgcG